MDMIMEYNKLIKKLNDGLRKTDKYILDNPEKEEETLKRMKKSLYEVKIMQSALETHLGRRLTPEELKSGIIIKDE